MDDFLLLCILVLVSCDTKHHISDMCRGFILGYLTMLQYGGVGGLEVWFGMEWLCVVVG